MPARVPLCVPLASAARTHRSPERYVRKCINISEFWKINFCHIAFNRSKIATFRYPTCVQCRRWSGSLHHITRSDISLKLHALGYIAVAESLGISSPTFTQCAAKATEFGEITRKKRHYALQGHSRSPILVPIESSHMTSY